MRGLKESMYPRTNYEMTEDDLKTILEACKPVPMIMLQCGTPRSPQERANDAWAALGTKMGFDHMTVQPAGRGDRFFSAIPSETEQHRIERLAAEEVEKKRQEVERLTAERDAIQARLTELLA